MTPNQVADKGKVNTSVIVQTGIKAAGDAVEGDYQLLGVTGKWIDDDDSGTVTMDDIFSCTGVRAGERVRSRVTHRSPIPG